MRADAVWPWVGRVFLWLVPCFALWHFAAAPLAEVQGTLARFGANAWFPGLVSGTESAGGSIDFVTRLRATQTGRVGDLVFTVNARAYSYGLALFAALCLATGWRRRWMGLAAGFAALLLVAAGGVLFDLLQQVFITQAALSAGLFLPTDLERNIIALTYQAGAILLPTAAPIVAWGAVHRNFLAIRMRDRRDIPQVPC
jgi:hypothetical protein